MVCGSSTPSDVGPGLGTIHDNYVEVSEAEDSGEYLNAMGTRVRS